MLNLDLSNFFTTKSQATDFSERLNFIIDNLYTVDFNLEQALSSEFGMSKKDALVALLREQNITVTAKSDVQNFFKKIQERIGALPTLSLTIAFSPNEETLKILSQWFLFTLQKQVIFDIRVDKSLIGGAAIMFDGKYKDYSLKTTFDKILSELLKNPSTLQTNKPPILQNSPIHQSTEHMSIGR